MALGALPARVVELVQEVVDEVRRGREAGSAAGMHTLAADGQGALAATQGQSEEVVKGVQHKPTVAKLARDAARLVEKRLLKTRRRGAQARKQVDDAWAIAEELSQAAGHPYKNRQGQMVNVRPDMSIVNLALRRYEQETRLPQAIVAAGCRDAVGRASGSHRQ